MSYASSLTIEELDSQGNPGGQSLVLVGSGLPFQGASWGGKNALKTTWYPGNAQEATQQILGPQEVPSHWQGEWRRTLLGKSPCSFTDDTGSSFQLAAPLDLWNAMESILRKGQRLRVTWAVSANALSSAADQNGKVVREGRASDWRFSPDRLQDIGWEITFEWVSRGSTQDRVTSTRTNTINSDGADLQNALNALIAANELASLQQFNPTSLTLGQLEAIANYPTTLVNSLTRSVQQIETDVATVVNIAATLASQPASIANRAVDLARDTVAQTNNMKDTLGQVPVEYQSVKTDIASLCRAHNTFGPQADDAVTLARAAQVFAQNVQTQLQAQGGGKVSPTRLANQTAVIQVYICHQNDTPHNVSQKFYGSPDHAVDILQANKLPWHLPVFPAGKVIIIPVLPTVSATSQV